MPAADQMMQLYRELAEIYDRQGQAQMRDRFLVLAADTAFSAGKTAEAERCACSFYGSTRTICSNPTIPSQRQYGPRTWKTTSVLFAVAIPTRKPSTFWRRCATAARWRMPTVDPAPGRRTVSLPTRPRQRRIYKSSGWWTLEMGTGPILLGRVQQRLNTRSPGINPWHKARALPPAKRGDPPSRSNIASNIYALGQDPGGPGNKTAGFEPAEDEPGFGAWVSVGLAVVVFMGGLFIAACTFARPFVPRGWLP